MAVTVRDLEVALVLAREARAANGGLGGPSLRADQLRQLFGAEQLDEAERTRIQAALEMAGVEPQPSLLAAEPDGPVRFGAAADAAPLEDGNGQRPGSTANPGNRQEFPTVREFARATLDRARRRRQEDSQSDDMTQDEDPPPPAVAPEARVDGDALDFDHGLSDTGEPTGYVHAYAIDEPSAAVEADHSAPAHAGEPEPPEGEVDEPGAPLEDDTPEEASEEEQLEQLIGHDPPEEDRPEEIPATDEERIGEPEEGEQALASEVVAAEVRAPVGEAPKHPADVRAPGEAASARPAAAEMAVGLLAATVLPVIATSVLGWRFGLPYVALALIAAGWLVGRSGASLGILATLRRSRPTRLALKVATALTLLGALASAALAAVAGNQQHPPRVAHAPPAPRPFKPPARALIPAGTRARRVRAHRRIRHTPVSQAPSAPSATPPEPSSAGSGSGGNGGTQGLIEVPPPSGAGSSASTAPPSSGTGARTGSSAR